MYLTVAGLHVVHRIRLQHFPQVLLSVTHRIMNINSPCQHRYPLYLHFHASTSIPMLPLLHVSLLLFLCLPVYSHCRHSHVALSPYPYSHVSLHLFLCLPISIPIPITIPISSYHQSHVSLPTYLPTYTLSLSYPSTLPPTPPLLPQHIDYPPCAHHE